VRVVAGLLYMSYRRRSFTLTVLFGRRYIEGSMRSKAPSVSSVRT